MKETERRADRWKRAMGVEQTEIDAIATLRPDLLDQLVRQAVKPYYDATLQRRVADARERWRLEAQRVLDETINQEQVATLLRRAAEQLDDLEEQVDALNEALRAEVPEGIELPPAVVPEPAVTGAESNGKPLLSSEWDYAEQTRRLIAHKAYSNGGAA